MGLSANDITLDSAGDSQQLTVNGAEGEVTWASEDAAVATVDDQGNVTAVARPHHRHRHRGGPDLQLRRALHLVKGEPLCVRR